MLHFCLRKPQETCFKLFDASLFYFHYIQLRILSCMICISLDSLFITHSLDGSDIQYHKKTEAPYKPHVEQMAQILQWTYMTEWNVNFSFI